MKSIRRGMSYCLCLLISLTLGLKGTGAPVWASDNDSESDTGSAPGEGEGVGEKVKNFCRKYKKELVISSIAGVLVVVIGGGIAYYILNKDNMDFVPGDFYNDGFNDDDFELL